MKIKSWATPNEQMSILGNHRWNVARLFELAKDLPVFEVPLDHLYVYYNYESLSLREMAMHIRAAEASDLDKPIILDEDGCVMDGRHRILRALWLGKDHIKAVRFDENPAPCQVSP